MNLIGPVASLITIIKKRKLKHQKYTMRDGSLHKIIVQGFVDGRRKSRATEEKLDVQHSRIDGKRLRESVDSITRLTTVERNV